MLAHKASAWTHRLVGLEVHKRIARSHCAIVDGDTEIGEVTSGTKSPWTGKSIALARIRRSHAKPGTTLEVDIRGKRVPATVVKGDITEIIRLITNELYQRKELYMSTEGLLFTETHEWVRMRRCCHS